MALEVPRTTQIHLVHPFLGLADEFDTTVNGLRLSVKLDKGCSKIIEIASPMLLDDASLVDKTHAMKYSTSSRPRKSSFKAESNA